MAKYSAKEVEIHKQFLTISDMKSVSNDKVVWETLRNALYGINHYDTGKPEKLEALSKLRTLVKERAINALEVINPQHLKQ
jgi:hypothetical protein